jgi:hypothetical protein
MTTRRWGIHKEREKICEVCGDKFRTTHARSKYCGDNCLRVANGHVVRIIRCVICGTAAQRSSPKQVTCMGDECRRLHTNAYHASRRQKRPERPFSCKHCGRSTTRQGTNRRRYCEVCTDIKHRYDVGNSHRARARKNGGDVKSAGAKRPVAPRVKGDRTRQRSITSCHCASAEITHTTTSNAPVGHAIDQRARSRRAKCGSASMRHLTNTLRTG